MVFDKYTVLALKELDEDVADLASFYRELIDEHSADRFQGVFYEVLESLAQWPNAHQMFNDTPNIRRIDLKTHKVAIIYIVDDGRLEVIAVKAFHTLEDQKKARELIEERVKLAKKQFG